VARRRLDLAGLFDWETIKRLESSSTFFTTEHIALFSAVYERINDIFSQLGDSPEVFGLIHADLIWKNYFFHEAGVGALDFDSCSWGYYLYDLAPTLLGYRDESHYLALRQALLAGYRQIRPLPEHQEPFLDTLIAARHIVSRCWLAKRLDIPHLRQQAETILAYRTAEIRNLLDGASP